MKDQGQTSEPHDLHSFARKAMNMFMRKAKAKSTKMHALQAESSGCTDDPTCASSKAERLLLCTTDMSDPESYLSCAQTSTTAGTVPRGGTHGIHAAPATHRSTLLSASDASSARARSHAPTLRQTAVMVTMPRHQLTLKNLKNLRSLRSRRRRMLILAARTILHVSAPKPGDPIDVLTRIALAA